LPEPAAKGITAGERVIALRSWWGARLVASILAVSGEAATAAVCRQALAAAGHTVAVCAGPPQAVRALTALRADAVCLDTALGADGIDDLCRWLRSDPDRAPVPVLFLLPARARWAESSLLPALRPGYDDYLVRPVDPDELVEKVSALLTLTPARRPKSRRFLREGPFIMDSETHELWADGRKAKLTPTEFRLLAYLMERADRSVSLDELLENVWGHLPGTGAAEVVRAHVSNLRHKMSALGGSARLLRTLPNRGYRLSRGERA